MEAIQLNITKTKVLTPLQATQINALWNSEYPAKLKNRFPILLDGTIQYNHYIIEDTEHNVLAWAVDFEKDNETRFSILVDSKHQGKGLGAALMERLKTDVNEFYGWVIDHNRDIKSNGEHYSTPMPFYTKLGFTILHDQRIDTDMISAVKIKWST